ncbi:MAG: hypothetical protein AAFV07_06205, partial [Bacteroidota bacterium]
TTGKGESRGLEGWIEKTGGTTQAKLTWAWSQSTRQFESDNLGRPYPYQFDRPFQTTLQILHALNHRWNVAGVWTYAAPHPVLAFYWDEPFDINPIGEKNSTRGEAYHRLDLSMQYVFHMGRSRHEIKLGLYNAYNRPNVAFEKVRFSPNGTWDFEPVTLLPRLPSLSYQLRF